MSRATLPIYCDARWYSAEAAFREARADAMLNDAELRRRMAARRAARDCIRNAQKCMIMVQLCEGDLVRRVLANAENYMAAADMICDDMRIGPGLFRDEAAG